MDLKIYAEFNAFDAKQAPLTTPARNCSSCKTRKSLFLPSDSFPNSFLIHVRKASKDGLLLDVKPLLSSSLNLSSLHDSPSSTHHETTSHQSNGKTTTLLGNDDDDHHHIKEVVSRDDDIEANNGLRDCISLAHESLKCGSGLPSVLESLKSSKKDDEGNDKSGGRLIAVVKTTPHDILAAERNLPSDTGKSFVDDEEATKSNICNRKGILKRSYTQESQSLDSYETQTKKTHEEKQLLANQRHPSSQVSSSKQGSHDSEKNYSKLMPFVQKSSYSSFCDENSGNKKNSDNEYKCDDDNKSTWKTDDDAKVRVRNNSLRESGHASSSTMSVNAFSYLSSNDDNSDLSRELKRRRRIIEEAEQQENEFKMKLQQPHQQTMTPTNDHSATSSLLPQSPWRSFPGLSFLTGSSKSPAWESNSHSGATTGTPTTTGINLRSYQLTFSILIILYIAIRTLLS